MQRLWLFLALVLPATLLAQTPCESGFADIYPCENIDLMAFMPKEDFGNPSGTNDIWGWYDEESGREFAILCHRSGTAFIEVTDPVNPVWIGSLASAIPGNNTWRDAKVFSDHVFIVSEFTDHGMQVMDLNKLLDPALEIPVDFEVDAYYEGFGKAHNIVINEDSGHAFAVGSNTADGGLHIVDISDPLNPTILGTHSESGYCHDAQVVGYHGPDSQFLGKEIAFCCNDDYVAIVDVSDPTDPIELSTVSYENPGYIHQGWLTEDHRYFLTNDETDELNFGVTTTTYIFDMADLANPMYIGNYVSDNIAIDHNHYVLDTLLYQSNYRSGLRVLDISDVGNANLEQFAFFDCLPTTDEPGFTGTWSNYPYLPSGNIVISDITQGMFVLRLSETTVGCTDELACNYNPSAEEDNGSCTYAEEFYDCEGTCLNDTDQDGVCDELEVPGCTDVLACNYSETATDDDATCVYAEPFYNCEGECLNDTDGDGVCDELEEPGCMDPAACNYSEVATDDNGSCYFWTEGTFGDPVLEVSLEGNNVQTYTYTAGSGGMLDWSLTGGVFLSGTDTETVQVEWNSAGTGSLCVNDTWFEGCAGQVCISVDVAVGIDEFQNGVLALYPNPANFKCWLELEQTGLAQVTIRDAQGRVAMAFDTQGSGLFETSELAEGTYTVEVVQGAQRSTLQLVVQH